MRAEQLANHLARIRTRIGFPWVVTSKAYEIISDHMSQGVPRWHGLYYGRNRAHQVLKAARQRALEDTIEALRKENNGLTHHTLARKKEFTEPFLYRISGNSADVLVHEFVWWENQWRDCNVNIRGDLQTLHQCVLWPGLFSNERDGSYVSLVLGYKALDRVFGIWAFHALAKGSECLLSDNSAAFISKLLYPPVCCLNAAFAARLQESERQRWDLAVLAQEAFVGRHVEESGLRGDISEHPRTVPKLVKDIIDGVTPFDKLSADRSNNYRRVFNALLNVAMENAGQGTTWTSSWRVDMLSRCFIGWHMGTRTIAGSTVIDDAGLFLDTAMKQVPLRNPEHDVGCLKELLIARKAADVLRLLVHILFTKESIMAAAPVERLAYLVLAKTLVEDSRIQPGFGSCCQADLAIRLVFE